MRWLAAPLAAGALLLSAPAQALQVPAQAQTEAPPIVAVPVPRPPELPLPRYALTFSPVYLAVPMGQVSAEVRVRDKVGIGAVAGIGWLTFDASPVKSHLLLYQLAAQGRYYVLGNFRHGLQLGAQVAYLRLASPFQNQVQLSSDALGLAPFVGYKYTMKVGFTFETQLGYEFLLARGTFDRESTQAGASVLLFDIRVGWSF